jgi:hypothetical protein
MARTRNKKTARPRAATPAVAPLRKLDKDAWKVFSRKAGVMKHRTERRRKQREREDLKLET